MREPFFTTGRLALIAALQANETLAAEVRKWFTWGSGLRQRWTDLPKDCPQVVIAPATFDIQQPTNVLEWIPQHIEIGVLTDDQDVAQCERLMSAAIDVCRVAKRSCFGLSAQGCSGLDFLNCEWEPVRDKVDKRIRWAAVLTISIRWIRHMLTEDD